MSACISVLGEYSDHELTKADEPFTCQRCFVFDEAGATAEINRLRAEVKHWKDHAEEAGEGFSRVCQDYARVSARNAELVRRLEVLVRSPEANQYRDEACRHAVEQPYADNRYVRLLDAVREVLG